MTNRTGRAGVLVILAAITLMMGGVCNMPLPGGSTDVQQAQSSCPGKTAAEVQGLIDMAKGLELGGTTKSGATELLSGECQGTSPTVGSCNVCAETITDIVYGIPMQPVP